MLFSSEILGIIGTRGLSEVVLILLSFGAFGWEGMLEFFQSRVMLLYKFLFLASLGKSQPLLLEG